MVGRFDLFAHAQRLTAGFTVFLLELYFMIKMFHFILIFKADDANSHKSNGVPRLEVFVFFFFFFICA